MRKRVRFVAFLLCILLLVASCEKKVEYMVVFDSKGGSKVNGSVALEGELVVRPENPTKEGYMFEGWYNGKTLWDFDKYKVSENVWLEARWNPIIYRVTYVYVMEQGISEASILPSDENPLNFTADSDTYLLYAPSFSIEGLNFAGWYTDESCTKPIQTINTGTIGDLTLYGRVEIQKN